MRINNKVVTLAALSTASVALIGVGASATFTDTVTTTGKITAGTLDLGIAAFDGGRFANPSGTTTAGDDVNFGDVGPVTSNYTQYYTFRITNNGTLPVPAGKLAFTLSQTNGGTAKDLALIEQSKFLAECGDANEPAASGADTIDFSDRGFKDNDGRTVVSKKALAPTEFIQCEVLIRTREAGLDNDAQGGTFTPKLTIVGSDV